MSQEMSVPDAGCMLGSSVFCHGLLAHLERGSCGLLSHLDGGRRLWEEC